MYIFDLIFMHFIKISVYAYLVGQYRRGSHAPPMLDHMATTNH